MFCFYVVVFLTSDNEGYTAYINVRHEPADRKSISFLPKTLLKRRAVKCDGRLPAIAKSSTGNPIGIFEINLLW